MSTTPYRMIAPAARALLAVARPAEAQRLRGARHDFTGVYEGSHDGRHAVISISARTRSLHPPTTDCESSVRFIDDGSRAWRTCFVRRPDPADIQRDVSLRPEIPEITGPWNVEWKAIHLHTWDTNHLSGVCVWNGTEYGIPSTGCRSHGSDWFPRSSAD